MGTSCYHFLLFRDRPSIQTMASVCFAMNSIHLVAVLYTAMSADDAIVILKLNGIESTVTELHIAGGSRFVIYYITVFADLFLIIGIEDNCRLGMLTFIWWNSFRIFLEVLTIVGVGIWKGTSENFTLIMSFLSCLGLTLLIQGFFTRRVFHYSAMVRPSVRLQGVHGDMPSGMGVLSEPAGKAQHSAGATIKDGDEETTETRTAAHRAENSDSRAMTDTTKPDKGTTSADGYTAGIKTKSQ
ncbi:uncharacterized protein LOC144136306 [Amblyomma americanum]